jgi:lipid II:glycine glycyltransferase (peptidoglycan interpeptide bridge formation enzyme)
MINKGWQVEVDRSTSAEWSQMLDLFEDANLYQTWAYGSVRWGEKNLSHLILKRGGEVLGIAQVRVVRPTPFKFGMAYLRWGPLFERRGRVLDPEVVVLMAQALEQEYVRKRKLFLKILPNAFAGSARATAFQTAFCRFTTEPLAAQNTYRTFVLDLSPCLEKLRRKLDAKWRNHLSRAERNDLKVISGTGKQEYDTFLLIYKEMLDRKTFETTVDVDEFSRIQADLPELQRMRILVCEHQGVPVAATVVAALGDSAIYVLGATSAAGLKSQGAYLLQWTAIKWLKEKGIRWYDLGGIDPERNPGVYSFKRGMSGTDVCQISPLVASKSLLSSAFVKAGMALQSRMRGSMRTFFGPAQNPSQLRADVGA